MNRHPFFKSALLWVLAAALGPTAATARDLSFQERLAAEERIQRVYYSHQVGTSLPFEQVVPRDVLEKRVSNYLKESAALRRFWGVAVTAEDLRREMLRMSSSTHLPARLEELYAALGHDSFLVQECLARPALVDRWARSFFSSDPRFGERRWDEWWTSAAPGLPADSVRAVAKETAPLPVPFARTQDAWTNSGPQAATATNGGACVPDDLWRSGDLGHVPYPRSHHTAVWTGSLMIVWGGGDTFLNTGGRYDPIVDTWTPVTTVNAPAGREDHTAVWTGSLMIVWGGQGNLTFFNTGGRYDPIADSWTPTTTSGAPAARWYHTAVWTGAEMIVWGGRNGSTSLNTGGRYNPATDNWTPVSLLGVPRSRYLHTAVWTGSRMIVWGGDNITVSSIYLNDGGLYDPASDSWSNVSTNGAPTGRAVHTAVWTGNLMIVWGGTNGSAVLNTGGRYDPGSNSWTPTSTVQAPEARQFHRALWVPVTATMVVWGGQTTSTVLDTGSQYNPAADTWKTISPLGAPSARAAHTAVWTGEVMVAWGGAAGSDLNTGGRYDPQQDTWRPTSPSQPAIRYRHTAVWTGNDMIVWGGLIGGLGTDTGGRYNAATDSWTATSTLSAPEPRGLHTAVWTGQKMFIWGGAGSVIFGDGGLYDPIADLWQPVSIVNAPVGRNSATSVWTGSRVVVWGGHSGPDTFNTGGLYDPASDSWSPVSTTNAPSARTEHTAVWTGSRMLIWGGRGGSNGGMPTNTGGQYDPAADSWVATNTTGAPTPRYKHTAVWTGSRMIVWGGHSPSDVLNTGGSYDPVGDGWTPTSTSQAPDARYDHTAVWTGQKMLVWGGRDVSGFNGNKFRSGGRYDPASDVWVPTSQSGTPAARYGHTAIWMDGAMAVWGGYDDSLYYNDGSRYGVDNPDSDLDGVADACDCAPSDASATAVPREVVRLTLEADRVTLSWTSAAPGAGSGTVHDVLKGPLADLPVGTGPETCLASGIPATTTADPATPAPGAGYRYLVRGRNVCAAGTYGFTSDGAERTSTACP